MTQTPEGTYKCLHDCDIYQKDLILCPNHLKALINVCVTVIKYYWFEDKQLFVLLWLNITVWGYTAAGPYLHHYEVTHD